MKCLMPLGAIGLFSICNLSAFADEPQSTARAESSEGQLAEIVVTAEKREQGVNSVGMSITALSGEQLQNKGIESTSDLVKVVPGLTYTVTGYQTPVYTLRGVGYFEASLSADPAVMVYVDEIPLPFAAMTTASALDLERVEVLQGPQGTLFGKNASGGAINFIAAKPTDSFQAGFGVGYGRFEQYEADGFVSGPLTNTLEARVAFKTQQGGAWQQSQSRDATNGKTNLSEGRLLLDWKPTDAFKIELNLNGWFDHSQNQAAQLYKIVPKGGVGSLGDLAAYNRPAPTDARAADWNPDRSLTRSNSFRQAAVRADYDLSDTLRLTSLTSYEYYDQRSPQDNDGLPISDIDVQNDGHISAVSQELRLAGTLSSQVRWLVGGNYESDDTHGNQIAYIPYSLTNPVAGVRVNGLGAYGDQSSRTYAAFAHLEYEIVRNLTLSGGIRYTKDDKKFTGCGKDDGDGLAAAAFTNLEAILKKGQNVIPIAPGACSTYNLNLDPALVNTSLKQSNVPWRVGVDWKGWNDILLYGNVSSGFKAGGSPITTATSVLQFTPVTQEKLIAYETGFKAPLLDKRLQLNGAVFYYDYTNKQVRGIILVPVLKTGQAIVNVPKSQITGAELQLQAVPMKGLDLSASMTYLDSQVDSYTGATVFGTIVNFAGSPLPYTPKWQAVGDAQYTWHAMQSLDAFVGAGITYNSSTNAQFTGYTGDSNLAINSYSNVDVRFGVQTTDDRWRLMALGRNVTNQYHWTSVNSLSDVLVRYAAMPAMYEVKLIYRFQ